MCKRCDEIERHVSAYRRTLRSIDDDLAISLLAEVISDLEAEKASLHAPGNDPEKD